MRQGFPEHEAKYAFNARNKRKLRSVSGSQTYGSDFDCSAAF